LDVNRYKYLMKTLIIMAALFLITGCSTIEKYWPRDHDPVLVNSWVSVKMALDAVDCGTQPTGWSAVTEHSQRLYLLSDFRSDPQTDNLRGLRDHSQKMAGTTNKTFCQLGKKTAEARLAAARTAWAGR
jgi:hypothetical protein